ncbi:hypothetical protein G8759_32145 [Spirosoma aureum]|uniref:YD repeat-containing protein n=1 Tax=Spirosoma aureum TaxID=2692134 RepID=A0A6G9AX21_9BACT|nr:hypothetical protein [Spirosoma aureum]QIP16960.1 hypothetical protein G8759_32145 [Spirosoma aureum]
MRIGSILIRLSYIAVLLKLTGCSAPKTDEPGPTPHYRLHKTTSYAIAGRTVNVDTTVFTYDATGRLTNYESHGVDPKLIRKTTLSYNTADRIDHIDQILPSSYVDGVNRIIGFRAVYGYNANGNAETVKLSLITEAFTLFIPQDEYSLTYGADNIPTKISHVNLNSPYQDEYNYVYSGGNAVKVRYSTHTQTVDYSYLYDDKPNAYKGIVKLIPTIDPYNKNNLISDLTPTYNEQGYLIKTIGSGQYQGNIATYEYEQYLSK